MHGLQDGVTIAAIAQAQLCTWLIVYAKRAHASRHAPRCASYCNILFATLGLFYTICVGDARENKNCFVFIQNIFVQIDFNKIFLNKILPAFLQNY